LYEQGKQCYARHETHASAQSSRLFKGPGCHRCSLPIIAVASSQVDDHPLEGRCESLPLQKTQQTALVLILETDLGQEHKRNLEGQMRDEGQPK
jgi:hypothetical protein